MDGDIVVVSGEGVSYRASSLGSCTRALAAARQEMEPWRGPLPVNISETFQRGHDTEKVGIKWYEDRGWGVINRQLEVVVQLTGRLRIVGHIDMTVTRPPSESYPSKVVDVKRQSDEEWAKGSIRDSWLWHKYAWQFSAYAVATGMDVVVQRINDAGEVKLEEVEVPYGRVDLLRRVLEVEQLATVDLKGTECDRQDFPCPYWRVLHEEPEPVVEVEDEELATLALHYKRLEGDIAPLSERRKEIRKRLVEKVDGKVKDKDSGIEVWVTKYDIKERVMPAGTGTRVSVKLNDATDVSGVSDVPVTDAARPDQ